MIKLLAPFFIAFSFFAYAVDPIDQEIERLEAKLKEYRLKEMNTEIKSQNEMLLDWDTYSKNIQEAENYEHEAEKIEKRLQELRSRKESKSQ